MCIWEPGTSAWSLHRLSLDMTDTKSLRLCDVAHPQEHRLTQQSSHISEGHHALWNARQAKPERGQSRHWSEGTNPN